VSKGIIDFKKQKFIRDCKEYLKTGVIADSLRIGINNTTPGHLEYLKSGLTIDDKKVIDTAIERIKKKYVQDITNNRQKMNIVAIAALENLSTIDRRFEIKEVMERYRESINPIKALYYDLQEIMFLYDGKTKKDHHKFLIEKFNTSESFEEILLAVDRDIEDLRKCKDHLRNIRDEYSLPGTSEYSRRVVDLHNEMEQWKKLFKKFPEWVVDNKSDEQKSWLRNTLNNFFSRED
jgi:DNA polymerase III delta prime subunit